jgi:hypothetical protein
MRSIKATVFLGALLSTGMLIAQQSNSGQPSATTSQPDTSLGTTPGAQSAPAQAGGRHMANPDQQVKHLAKQLGLSNDQQAQLQPILASRAQQIQQLRSDASLAPRDRRMKARAIMQGTQGKIEALLSDAQKQQYEQMLADRKAHNKRAAATSPQA